MPRPTLVASLLALPLLTACEGLRTPGLEVAPGLRDGTAATEPGGPASAATPTDGAAGRAREGARPAEAPVDHRAAAIAALRADDLDAAADHVAELRFARDLAAAEAALAAGGPEDALTAVDRALAVHPRSEAALWVKGDGSLALAQRMIDRGMGAQFVEGAFLDAFEAYRTLPATCRARTGASRAAASLGRSLPALRFAREAMELAPGQDDAVRTAALRAWAEAAYRAYSVQVLFERDPSQGEDLDLESTPLFHEADDALARLAAEQPEDPWTWRTLGDLMLWVEAREEAALRFAAGLDHHPDDALLVERLSHAYAARGPAGLVEGLAEVHGRLPHSAPLGLALGRERVRAAAATVEADPEGAGQAFRVAEDELAAVRALDEALASECLSWEVIARAGQGWAAYHAGDLELASRRFLAMEELFEGGLTWSLGAELRSGIDGLWFVGDQHRQAGQWELAAEAFEALSHHQPDDVNWANNAGFFCRDAAVELELRAGALCAAAAGEVDDVEQLAALSGLAGVPPELLGQEAAAPILRGEADRLLERAWDLARRSLAAYRRAASLAPEDVRVVNDTALVAIYYVHDDIEGSEALLRQAMAAGEAQLAAADAGELELEERARLDLEEAWGDAYQNMGVLELIHRRDAAAALPWLERSVEIGPVPRPLLTEALIPWCRGELDVPLARVMPEVHWGAPCGQR